MSGEHSSDGLQVRCPACHERCELTGNDSTCEIRCDSCGTLFSLSPEETKPYVSGQEVIGQFQLVDHLGSGTFGDVWLAKDTILDRQVALKVARRDRYDRTDADLFFREARAAAQLKHPNIVSVHEVGRDGDRLFIVSDFIRGATLGDHIASRRYSSREAAELCATIADGLHHAHEAGVVHRDLKPQNIILDLGGVPHIADFGLAKRDTGEMTITLDGNVIGTPSYMSPEQAQGDAHQTDRRTDVYSLGVILFLMLTDELPFRGNYRMLLVQIINDAPPSLRRLESSISRDLETICLKCLEKRPEHRYETAAELADDLRRWLARKPIMAAPPGVVGRVIRWGQRKPAFAALSMILAVVIFVSSIAVIWQYQRAVKANRDLMITQVDGLRTANAEEARVLLSNIARFDEQVLPELRASRAATELSERQRTRFAIALLPHEPIEVDYLFNRLPEVEVDEIELLRDALLPYSKKLTPELWKSATAEDTETSRQLRLAAALALFDPESERWSTIANDVVASLTALDEVEARTWGELLSSAKRWLLPEFHTLFETTDSRSSRDIAARAMIRILKDDSNKLTELLRICDIRHVPAVAEALKPLGEKAVSQLELLARLDADLSIKDCNGICNAAATLAHLDRADVAWSLLESDVPPDVRVNLVHRFAPTGVAPEILARQLSRQTSSSVRQSILLALGEYKDYQMTSRFQNSVTSLVAGIYERDPDAGVHSAAKWLLGKWKRRISDDRPQPLAESRNWYVNATGTTMIVVPGPVEYRMGSPSDEPSRMDSENQRDVRIDYSFAMGSTEVTVHEFRKFSDCRHDTTIGPDPDCPVNTIKYNELVAYCRWLTLQDGMTEDDMCYPPVDLTAKKQVLPYEDFLSRHGYRPPTEEEWEYMCRAGSTGARFTGTSPEMLLKYAWVGANSNQRTWPVGLLKPNPFGLFDIYGNVRETVIPEGGRKTILEWIDVAHHRSGCFGDSFATVRSAEASQFFASRGYTVLGARVARTLP